MKSRASPEQIEAIEAAARTRGLARIRARESRGLPITHRMLHTIASDEAHRAVAEFFSRLPN